MPPGTPFHGFIQPFPIRVDEFSSPPSLTIVPALHLLSHTHSDHIVGLSAKSFASIIICSPDAKEMLLKHEVYSERALKDMDLRAEAKLSRTFRHLKVPPLKIGGRIDYQGSRDLLKTLPLGTPTVVALSDTETVTITLFDANHCPGAVMFLVEGPDSAILHTGDFRAEPWFLDTLRHSQHLEPYLAPDFPPSMHSGSPMFKQLDAIYLDTACFFSTTEVPSKRDGSNGLVRLMSLLPSSTIFFINSWTWGYEEVLKTIARRFHCKIHVDSYKYNIYTRLSDKFLGSIFTDNPAETRFHACERFDRCSHAAEPLPGDICARKTVYVNPVTMGIAKWTQYLEQTEQLLQRGEIVDCLLVPLSRHSPLPELRSFVSMFRPKRVIPNTLDPALRGLDWKCINPMLEGCLSPEPDSIPLDARDEDLELQLDGKEDGDAALKNLQGEGIEQLAASWAESGKSRQKLELMEKYLVGSDKAVVQRLLSKPVERGSVSSIPQPEGRRISIMQRALDKERIKACIKPAYLEVSRDSDSETDNDDEEHARTAHALFAGMAGIASQYPGAGASYDSEVERVNGAAVDADGERGEAIDTHFSPPTPSPSPAPTSFCPQLGAQSERRDHPVAENNVMTTQSLNAPSHLQTPPATRVPRSSVLVARKRQAHTEPSQERAVSPLIDLCNIPSSQHLPSQTESTHSEPLPKRRKTGSSLESVAGPVVPLPETTKENPSPPLSPHVHTPTPKRHRHTPAKEEDWSHAVPEPLRAEPTLVCVPGPSLATASSTVIFDRSDARLLKQKRLTIRGKLALAMPQKPGLSSTHGRNTEATATHHDNPRNRRHKDEEHGTGSSSRAPVLTLTTSSFRSVEDSADEDAVDWERSRVLADTIRSEVASGRRPIIPRLMCVNGQSRTSRARR